MNGHVFTDDVIVADMKLRRFVTIFQIGGSLPYCRELVNVISGADSSRSFDHHVRLNLGTFANLNAGPNPRPGAHLH